MPRRGGIPYGMSLQQEYEVEKIIKTKYDDQLKTNLYLVKWKGYADHLNTWEPEWNLENSKEILNDFKKKNKNSFSDVQDENGNQSDCSTNYQEEDYQPNKKNPKKKSNKRKNDENSVNTRSSNKKQHNEDTEEPNQKQNKQNETEESQKYTRFLSKGRAKYVIKKYFKNSSGVWMFDFQQQQLGNVNNMTKSIEESLEYLDPKQIITFLLQKLDSSSQN
ncbi:hypothetical protein ABPG72_019316 [Tetrahymena utriculariae]